MNDFFGFGLRERTVARQPFTGFGMLPLEPWSDGAVPAFCNANNHDWSDTRVGTENELRFHPGMLQIIDHVPCKTVRAEARNRIRLPGEMRQDTQDVAARTAGVLFVGLGSILAYEQQIERKKPGPDGDRSRVDRGLPPKTDACGGHGLANKLFLTWE